ncbi:MAG: patatin-like phospholipase family protein [Acidobacteria bacterium]|nr:patatin-like phospholipase family protein [Acidobacteriota bacterium]
MNATIEKQEIPLHLCQVLEEEFESLHEQPDAEGDVDASVKQEGLKPSAPLNWEFYPGHVAVEKLAETLQAAYDDWEAKRHQTEGGVGVSESGTEVSHAENKPLKSDDDARNDKLRAVEDLTTYLALRYPALRKNPTAGETKSGGAKDKRLDILNLILQDRDEDGKPNGPDFSVYRKARFEPKLLREETRGLLEIGWPSDGAEAFDDSRGARSDLRRFRRLLLEDAFPAEIKRVYDLRVDEAVRRIHALEKKRSAVCFSGGGIRSGTFALGVIQSLAQHDLLKEFDYLSTVSGGGYVGGWLTAWIHRHPRGLEGVVKELNGSPRNSKIEPEPEPLAHLRDFSNFITPRAGILSADSWTFIVIYIRNLLLNWVVLIPLLASVLMIPRVANAVVLAGPAWRVLAGLVLLGGLSIFLLKPDWKTFGWVIGLGIPSLLVIWAARSGALGVVADRTEREHYIMGTLLVAGALLSSYALAFMRLNRPSNSGVLRPGSYWDRRRDQNSFLWMCLLPLAVSATLLTVFWAWFRHKASVGNPTLVKFFNWEMGYFTGFMLYGVALGVAGALIYGLLAAASWLRTPKEMWRKRDAWLMTPVEARRRYGSKSWSLAGSVFKNGGRELIVTLLASMLGALLLWVAAVKIDTFYYPVVEAFKNADKSVLSDPLSHKLWRSAEVYTYLAFPVYLLIYFLGLTLFVGLTSRRSEKPPRGRGGSGETGVPLSRLWNWVLKRPDRMWNWVLKKTHVEDEDREWLARASAWIFIVAGGWLLIGGMVLFGPVLYFDFGNWLAAAGGASGLLALFGGGSSRTPGGPKQQGKQSWLQTLGVNVLVIAAFVFFACIVIVVSILTATVIAWLAQFFTPGVAALLGMSPRDLAALSEHYPFQSRANVFHVLHFPSWLYLLALALGLQLFGRLFAVLINLNKFSLHAGYRDRIIRAFLGASRLRGERSANPFTGFDPRDNLKMSELRPWVLRESDFTGANDLTRFVDEINYPVEKDIEIEITDMNETFVVPGATRKAAAKALREAINRDEGESIKYFKDPPESIDFNASFRTALFSDLSRLMQKADLSTVHPFDALVDKVLERRAKSGTPDDIGSGKLDTVRMNRLLLNEAFPDCLEYPPKPHRLLHVINMTLNLVHGDRLAWQQRRAQSFTASPLHSGTLFGGYRPTLDYGGKNGITMGTAVAISGAAASSNMGYFSPSPFVTFVLTFFNARLGWWLGNPGVYGADTFFRSHPQSALSPIIDEAFGLTDDEHPYVLLSDGGHFENLGLYEMVLRRCRNIFVIDGSADPEGGYSDLGSAVRKIRIDFGIPIEFSSPFPILSRPESETKAGAYFAVGDIHYEAVDTPPTGFSPDNLTGKLIYIKPAIYNQEPRDIYNYAKGDTSFPHESTADQFFDEPQFESHRVLGYHILERLFKGAAPGDLQDFIDRLDAQAEREKSAAADAEQDKVVALFKAMLSTLPVMEGPDKK